MFLKLKNLWIVTLAGLSSDRIHAIIRRWNKEDRWGLGKQWIDAADSIGANVVEGCGRQHPKDALHFLYMARGSLVETENWLKLARNRGLISAIEASQLDTAYYRLSCGLNSLIAVRRKNLPTN